MRARTGGAAAGRPSDPALGRPRDPAGEPPPGAPGAADAPAPGPLRWLLATAAAGAVALGVMAFYLWIYHSKGYQVPLGWDTSRYLWRTRLAQAVGISHLSDAVQPFVTADPGRPGFPAVAGTFSSLFGTSRLFRLAAVLPAVTAASIGLAAGAFVAAVLRRSGWELAAVAFGVGTSAFVVRLMGPETYQDNLLAGAVFMAAALALGLAVRDRRALVPAALLLGAGGVIHWAFFAFMAAVVALAAVAYGPASWRRWRRGRDGLLDTPSARLVAAGLGGAAVAGTTIYGVLGADTRSPRLTVSEFAKKLRHDLPRYRLAVSLPAAVVGSASLIWDRARGRRRPAAPALDGDGRAQDAASTRGHDLEAASSPEREGATFALVFLLAWCGVTLGGYLAFKVLHLPVPAHRFLAFALAVPVLGLLGILWAGRLLARVARPLGGLAGPLGVALVLAALAWAGWIGHAEWYQVRPWVDAGKVEDARAAAAYLDAAGVPAATPVVFLVNNHDSNYVALMYHMVRVGLPAERIGRAYLYAGSPRDYLAHRPTGAPGTEGRSISDRYLQKMRPTYARRPVAVLLAAFDEPYFRSWVAARPETVVAPDVAVVLGPRPASAPPAPAPLEPMRSVPLGLLAVASLAVLALAGGGWTMALLGRWLRPVEAVALAPAVGIAAVVVVGVVLDRLGVRLAGAGGLAALAVALASGWGWFALRARSPGLDAPAGRGTGLDAPAGR